MFGATAAALLGAVLLVIVRQAPDYDEFYTFYVTRPLFGLGDALFDHWLVDNHPPLFYALTRATTALANSVEASRGINVAIGSIAFACGVLAFRRDRKLAPIALLFFLFLAAQPASIESAAYLRSYFLSLCAVSLLVAMLTASWLGEPPRRGRRALLAGAIVVSLNTHVVTTLIAGTFLLTFTICTVLRGRFALLRIIWMPVLVAALAFAVTSIFQLPGWMHNTHLPPPDFGQLLPRGKTLVRDMLLSNPLMVLVGGLEAAWLVVGAVRQRRVSAELEVMLMFGIGGLSLVAVLLSVDRLHFLVTERYLIGLNPAVAMMLALGTNHLIGRLGGRQGTAMLLAIAAVGLLSIFGNARHMAAQHYPKYETIALRLKQSPFVCRDPAFHVASLPLDYYAAMDGRDVQGVSEMALRTTLSRLGVHIEPAASRRMPDDCGTVFLLDAGSRIPTAKILLARVRAIGFPVTQIVLYRLPEDFYVASSRPLAAEAVARLLDRPASGTAFLPDTSTAAERTGRFL